MEADERPPRTGLLAFWSLAFALSWAVWIPAALGGDAPASAAPRSAARLLGAFGPSLAAVALVTYVGGRTGLLGLLRGLIRWRVPARWYAFALLFPAAVSLLGTALSVLLGAPDPDFTHPSVLDLYPMPEVAEAAGAWVLLPVVFLQNLLVGSSMGEELGWRGYVLPRLQADHGALAASLVLGIVWAGWHLPLGLFPDVPPWNGSPLAFLVGIVADAVLFTWVYNETDGSLLLALLFHASIATSGLFLPAVHVDPLLVPAMKWLVVLAIVRAYGARTLSRGERVTVGE